MNLLIVDDEKIIREGLRKLDWGQLGITRIALVDNGIDALEKFHTFNPHIILADIQMSGMTGIELAKEIQTSNCKIILLSGYDIFSYAQSAVKYGVFEYLLKPSSPQEILSTVERAIASLHSETINQNIQDYKNNMSFEYSGNSTEMKMILQYVNVHYMYEVSLATLSQQVHLTPSYISKLIKKETGYNFTKILSYIRMIKAAELLRNTQFKIYVICEKIGINDQRYFGQQFVKIYGKTPMEYRKLYQKENSTGMINIIKGISI